MSAANRALLTRILEGLAVGDGRAVVEAMAEDFTWTMIGSTDWSGVYRGMTAVRGGRRRCVAVVDVHED